ncbi:MAG: Trm112 family protein [Pseudodonghicola sp.]|nr:Trm112 family protein [Pseudodonghicola sp.]
MTDAPTNRTAVSPPFDRRMLEALICPQTQTTLDYDAAKQELISKAAGLAFPIRNGIPVMLVDEARTLE